MLKTELKKINRLLINKFGIPEINSQIPNPLSMLLGTILSQNTNDKNSYQAYKNLIKIFPDWKLLLSVKVSEIEKVIRVAGLGNQKARAIKRVVTYLSKNRGEVNLDYLREKENGEIINELTSLDGVGLKTASCVLLFSLERNVCPVDTHVHRTLNRTGVVKTSTPDKTFAAINPNLPEGIGHQIHTNLIKLGRTYCKPQKPACKNCPLVKICKYELKTDFEAYPSGKDFMLLDHI
ncbi:MAG: endonuclease III [Ignavibacteriaceae bacterium]